MTTVEAPPLTIPRVYPNGSTLNDPTPVPTFGVDPGYGVGEILRYGNWPINFGTVRPHKDPRVKYWQHERGAKRDGVDFIHWEDLRDIHVERVVADIEWMANTYSYLLDPDYLDHRDEDGRTMAEVFEIANVVDSKARLAQLDGRWPCGVEQYEGPDKFRAVVCDSLARKLTDELNLLSQLWVVPIAPRPAGALYRKRGGNGVMLDYYHGWIILRGRKTAWPARDGQPINACGNEDSENKWIHVQAASDHASRLWTDPDGTRTRKAAA